MDNSSTPNDGQTPSQKPKPQFPKSKLVRLRLALFRLSSAHPIPIVLLLAILACTRPGTDSSLDCSTWLFRVSGYEFAGNLVQNLNDVVLRKWSVLVLCLSVAFNGHLFRITRRDTEGRTEEKRLEGSNELPRHTESNIGEALARLGYPGAAKPTDVEQIVQSETETDIVLQEFQADGLTDEEIISLSLRGEIASYDLEKTLNYNFSRAVKVRRAIISRTKLSAGRTHSLEQSKLPYGHYDWSRVFGACCENVIGYMPLPVGVAGPLIIDGRSYFIPMATTEGVLVASTSRGSKAINAGGGAVTVITADGMTRGPCVGFGSIKRTGAAKLWLDSEDGQAIMRRAFNSTSRFARLQTMTSMLAGTSLFIRFKTSTGDAMGMNMISKGVEHALDVMKASGFEDMDIVTLTGNYCTDKKPSAMNWIQGRGKSVVAEAIIPADVVKDLLKTDVDSMVSIFVNKNMIGSAMAGSVGGFNAQAANIVAAIFIATGQDPAQVVESSNCITIMKNVNGALQITVSMPCIEVGTLGGGTILEPQAAMLDLLGIRGPHATDPGTNSRRLARIIAAATMAGELSLSAALAAGHLVTAHMQHNRSTVPTRTNTPAPSSAAAV